MWGKEKEHDKRALWDREFSVVKHGLDEAEVNEFIISLIHRHREELERLQDELARQNKDVLERQEKELTRQHQEILGRREDELIRQQREPIEEQKRESEHLVELAQHTVTEAEKLAESIKEEAKQIKEESVVEASKIIADGERKAQELVEEMANLTKAMAKEVEVNTRAAREKASAIEADAKQQAGQFLEYIKNEIQREANRGIKGAYERLLPYVDEFMREIQALSVNLEEKVKKATEVPWRSELSTAETPEVTLPKEEEGAPDIPTEDVKKTQEAAVKEKAEGMLYSGKVELTIQHPVSYSELEAFHSGLQSLPQVSVSGLRQVNDHDYTIGLNLEAPIALFDVLMEMEPVVTVREEPSNNSTRLSDTLSKLGLVNAPNASEGKRILVTLKQ